MLPDMKSFRILTTERCYWQDCPHRGTETVTVKSGFDGTTLKFNLCKSHKEQMNKPWVELKNPLAA